MAKNKIFTVATLVVVLLVGISACSKPSDDASSINKGSESDNLSKSINDLSTDSTEKSHNNSINNTESSDSGDKIEEENQLQKPNNPDNNTSTQNQAKKSQNTDASPSNDVSSERKPVIVISSGEKAIQYLKQQLPEGKDEDVSFGVDETLATDDHGSYYAVQLVSVSTRVSGKTGNLGYYKVYQDGVYKTF
ncbi:hypothetical protein ACFSFW_10540 [Fredinandcohnia salidurans]|uniref:Lipoprotein n=1 Tax=Fredinandcohnia salidurans TaxID=2595041 RepID=A0ABW4MRY0_9BACI